MRSRPASAVLAIGALLGLLVTASCTEPPGADPGGSSVWTTATVPLPNRGIAYDSGRHVLLVSVSGSVPGIGNDLVEMDPRTGALGRSVPLAGGPGVVAVSGDGTRAYVGLVSSPAVAEIDLATFTVVRQFPLGRSTYDGPYYAEDIEVQPGHADVIAVSRRNLCCSPRHEGVGIYDEGVMRPDQTAGHTGADRITWSDSPGVIYGYNNETTGFGFYVLTVTDSGVTLGAPANLISGFGVDIEYADGQIHATNGQVVDASGPVLAGSYITSGLIEVDVASGTTAILNGSTLSQHDSRKLIQEGTRTVPSIGARDLVGAGPILAAAGSSSVLLMGDGVSASGFVLPPQPTSIVRAQLARTIPVSAREIVASPSGRYVYAVVPQAAPTHPGELVEINTATGVVDRSLFVGADPHRLAISEDGSTLMVGHNAANKLTEVRVSDLAAVRTVPLANGQWANDIAAVPGSPHSFAVVVVNHCCSPSLEGTLLVRDGAVLPDAGPGHTGATTIAFAGDPTRLYGFNGGTTDFGFSTMSVDATGIHAMGSVRDFMSGFGVELVSAWGRVYGSNGAVIDPTLPLATGSVAAGQPVPVPGRGRLLAVAGAQVQEFDLGSLASVSTSAFPGGNAVDATVAGDTTLAIATDAGSIVLVPLG